MLILAFALQYFPYFRYQQVIGSVSAVLILDIALIIYIYWQRQQTRAQENVGRLTAEITDVDEMEVSSHCTTTQWCLKMKAGISCYLLDVTAHMCFAQQNFQAIYLFQYDQKSTTYHYHGMNV